jgi:hypothetical protein
MIYQVQRTDGSYDDEYTACDVVKAGELGKYMDTLRDRAGERTERYVIHAKPRWHNMVAEKLIADPETLFSAVGQQVVFGLLTSSRDISDNRWLLSVTSCADDAFEAALVKARNDLITQGWAKLELVLAPASDDI